MMRGTAKVMFVAYVVYPTKAAVRHARYQAMIVLSVSAQCIHLISFLTSSRAVWGECSHVFHMHCLLKWIGTPASKQQCPMDRRTWGTLPVLNKRSELLKPSQSPLRGRFLPRDNKGSGVSVPTLVSQVAFYDFPRINVDMVSDVCSSCSCFESSDSKTS